MEELSGGSLSGNETVQHLAELSQLLAGTAEGDTIRLMLELMTNMFKAEGAVLWLLNEQKNLLSRVSVFHNDEARSKAFEQEAGEAVLKFGEGLAGLSWAEGKPKIMQLPSMFAQSSHAGTTTGAPVCSLAFPLLASGATTIGVMEVINCSAEICREGQQQLTRMLSTFVGCSIFGAYAMQHLQESETDLNHMRHRLKMLDEDIRELKNRLSKEHDQSVQNARYHSQFLSHVSRDIRTPLSGITSILELMQRNGLDPSLEEYAGIIKESADSVLSVLEELVEFSRQEAEQFAPSAEETKTLVVREGTVETNAQTSAQLGNVRVLVVNGLIGTTEFIEAYATASGIKCDATSRGQSALTAMKQALFASDPYDVVFIERVLPDMDAFEFARAVQRESQFAKTKLVLVSTFDSAARDDQALRSGFIEHIAKPMKQQQVISTLRAVMQGRPQFEVDEQEQLVKDQVAPAVARGQRMILVAEDNPVNQKVALLQLRELGFFGTVVANGREAMEVVKQAEFDAVLMDCQMPEIDGFEATRQIRQWEITTGRHIPIIAMTASALSSDREKCIAAGMDDYLSKPVTYDKLDSVLAKWVESKEAQELAGERHMQYPDRDLQTMGAGQAAEPVDMQGLSELLGPEEAVEVLQLFVDSTEELIASIKEAAIRHDSKLLKEAAHQLKGAASSVGANGIARTCLELEKCAKEDDWDTVPKLNDGLTETFQNAKSYIQTIIS